MAQAISSQQLSQYIGQIQTGGVEQARLIYDVLNTQGYGYAGWAAGVARGDSITGISALNYLQGTAMMGLGGEACRNLTQTQIDGIRVDMAIGYLQTLQDIALQSGGSVSRDVRYKETEKFHEIAFQNNGLTLDNWTLKTPMDIATQTLGEDQVEEIWEKLRRTGGTGFNSVVESTWLLTRVGKAMSSSDPATAQKAKDWMDKVPGPANWDQIKRFLDIVGSQFSGIGDIDYDINGNVNSNFTSARNLVIRRDPLVLDLDGDGLELAGASGATLFDHNADGIKTGTGWARPDDGFLVRDLNGNGTIDTGRELFGVDTIKSNSTLATDGFDALRDLDANGDGFITSADAAFSELKIWQDANQDGITQSGELKTLTELNITSIGVNGSSTGPQAGQVINNNTVALSATFTQNGQTHTVGAIDLETNNFFTEFPPEVVDEAGNPVPITAQAQALPQMNGSGMVRNLQAAASLSADLATRLETFAAATTRDAQRAQLDTLISAWADTSGFSHGLAVGYNAGTTYNLPPGITVAQYRNLIYVLEAFNGSRFYGDETGGPRPAGFAILSHQPTETGNVVYEYIISPPPQQLALLQQAYDALKESVYSALVVQTRLKPYLDSIELAIDETGVHFDTTVARAMANTRAASDTYNTAIDLVELHKYASATVKGVGWEPYFTLQSILENNTNTPEIQVMLAAEHVAVLGSGDTNHAVQDNANWAVVGSAGANVISGGGGNDELYGGAGNDTINGGAGVNLLDGGDGDDVLYADQTSTSNTLIGGAGNDTLSAFYYGPNNNVFEGGTGDDNIVGTCFTDTYKFNLGDGHDTIQENQSISPTPVDKLIFGAGILVSDISSYRVGNDMVFAHVNGTDKITVIGWFANSGYQIERVEFADGTVWNSADLTVAGLIVTGTAGDDVMTGTPMGDTLLGMGGNDTITGAAGTNILDGGDGDDVLYGEQNSTSNTLIGGAGNDTMSVFYYGPGNNVFEGGTGNDTITGGCFVDTYKFNLGDGQDTITENQSTGPTPIDKLVFGANIQAGDISSYRVGNDMVFAHVNGTDKITVIGWFANSGYQIERVEFSDGTIWNSADLTTAGLIVTGTTGDDVMTGTVMDDILHGGAGNDDIRGGAGVNILDGGDGDDVLYGEQSSTSNTLIGGAGNDTLSAFYYGPNNNVFEGGTGG
ncbi:calcium-binding protein, partial [Polaromonas sp. P5_D5]